MRIQVPQKAWNFTINWLNMSFSKRILFKVVSTTELLAESNKSKLTPPTASFEEVDSHHKVKFGAFRGT
jgi:hypothetical protein